MLCSRPTSAINISGMRSPTNSQHSSVAPHFKITHVNIINWVSMKSSLLDATGVLPALSSFRNKIGLLDYLLSTRLFKCFTKLVGNWL